jgi:type 1 glutamine amidotransferase
MSLNRRQMLLTTCAGLLAPMTGILRATARTADPNKELFFTKCSGFQHTVNTRGGDELSLAERILTAVGKEHGFEVTASKDGRMFDPDKIGQWDAFVFETTGDLTKEGTDKTPPMSKEGEQAFYEAVKSGKGFIGCHCATDTFGHHRGMGADDPYIQLIGGEFAGHGAQQEVTLTIADPAFPGAKAFGSDEFKITDEWYAIKNISDDLRAIYVQNTKGMQGHDYERPNYPSTWARMHGKGRVFYTSMGHREDVWENVKYQQLLLNALMWATGQVDADVTPNLKTAAPDYKQLPK